MFILSNFRCNYIMIHALNPKGRHYLHYIINNHFHNQVNPIILFEQPVVNDNKDKINISDIYFLLLMPCVSPIHIVFNIFNC